jgi:hypothetical protein
MEVEPDVRFQIGEADFEHANLPEAQQHIDFALLADKSLGLLEPGEERAELIEIATVRAAALVSQMIHFCWMTGGKMRDARPALIRFCAMCMLLNPGLFGKMSYEEMGKKLRVTKQALSKVATEFQSETRLHFRRSRRSQSTESFRKAAQRSWRKRQSSPP